MVKCMPEIEDYVRRINESRAREIPPCAPLTEVERRTVEHMADDLWGNVYDPRPHVPQADWNGNGYLNEYG